QAVIRQAVGADPGKVRARRRRGEQLDRLVHVGRARGTRRQDGAGRILEFQVHTALAQGLQAQRGFLARVQVEGVEVGRRGAVPLDEYRQARRAFRQGDRGGLQVLGGSPRVVPRAAVFLGLEGGIQRQPRREQARRVAGAAHFERVGAAGGGRHGRQEDL